MNETPTPSREPEHNTGMPQPAERDPYPRMILACMGIFIVLIIVIFGFIFYDFVHRTEQNVRPVRHPVTQPAEPSPAPAS